jgi:spoIIIJ-associated protein
MNERTTLEIIAPTVEEALSQGLSELGLPAEAVSVEVLDSGNKGLFGLGGRQVRVRLTVNPPGGPPIFAPAAQTGVSEPKATESRKKHEPASQARRTAEPRAHASEAPGAAEPRNKREPTPERPKVAAPRVKREPASEAPSTGAPMDGHDQLVDTTEAVVSKLLHHLGLQAQVSAHVDEAADDDKQRIHVDVRGEDLSALIGRHAETLNAFQYVASLIVGKERQEWTHLVVDVEGYRSRREKQLRQLANRMAEQVLKSGRRAALEPMSAGERRIIHLELRGHPAVSTESVGEEPFRKVTIIPKEQD